ncbi:glycosyltransferase family 4 protein, partial [Candidatus Pelagibacter sp.]|nr:glycosyltransferase family 4 protein [Candidatus Pelagibacter sp.]
MKIAFDHTIFLIQKYGGISRYFLEIQRNLHKKHNSRIFCPIHLNEFLNEKSKSNLSLLKINYIPKYMTKILNSINYHYNNIYFLKWKPEIIHKTYYNNYSYKKNKSKIILNVWDLSHEIYHDMYDKPSSWRPKYEALSNVDHVICSSKKTQKDLIEFYNFDVNNTSVVYQGTPNIQSSKKELHLDFKFFLYVGSRKKYKNFEIILKALSLNKEVLEDYKLICFGNENFEFNELRLMEKLNINKKDIILFNGNDEILQRLYQKAEALIYPSLNEGFGFPPLEAMSLGCPVIVSQNEAIKEAVGECGFYFNPKDERNLLDIIEKIINKSFDKVNLIQNGIKRSNQFN